MARFVFSKCPNCKKENQSNWVDLNAVKPGAKVFRNINLQNQDEPIFIVTCRHCHTTYKVKPPEETGGRNASA
jgi:hypothetical protein